MRLGGRKPMVLCDEERGRPLGANDAALELLGLEASELLLLLSLIHI